MLVAGNLNLAQFNPFDKEYELQRFVERGGNYDETSPHIYKLTYPDGLSKIYNLNCINKIDNENVGVETTIINVWEIDTTLYKNKFSFWQKVNIANNELLPVFVDDLNLNNLPELYGFSDRNRYPAPPTVGPVEIYELNKEGIFDSVFAFDATTIFVRGIGPVREKGGKEIFIRSRTSLNGDFYRSANTGVLPTSFDFTFYYEPNELYCMTFGDFDENGISDCSFVDGNNPSKIIIGEFRDTINNFVSNYEQVTEGDVPYGFAIGDFDQDGKTELAVGTLQSNVYIIEAERINTYNIVWRGLFSTFNAYMNTTTNDIDRNGKTEFWIGGQDFVEGITRFQCYEANGNNSYEQVAIIELRYINSFYANHILATDMDNDGITELIISVGQLVLVLKFDGTPNDHKYKIYYAKFGEYTQPGSTFYPVNIYDLDGDNKKDIILPMDIYVNPHLVSFSYLLRQNFTTEVESDLTSQMPKYSILNNYPNPFNPSTTIRFYLPEYSDVSITVYDILGNEIRLLLEENLHAGEYTIQWDGKDNEGNLLPGGVYFIQMTAGEYQHTIKSVLLK